MADEETRIVSTDEAILDSIGEGVDEQASDESTISEDTETPTDSDEATSTADDKQGTPGSDDEQQRRQAGGPQDLRDAQGNVIATGGKERRFYETAQREKLRADTTSKENETLKSQLEAINSAGTLGTQYSLSPEEITTGAQIMAAYKNDPIATIQYMLTQAQASGHNTEEIGSGGGMDAQAVKQMLETTLQPLISEHKERVDTQAVSDRAKEVYNGFMTQFPDAAVHEDSLARLLNEDNNLSPEAAYFKLQNFYLQRNLDWTKPLEKLQQEAATRQGENTQQQLPEGGVAQANVTDTAEVADVNTSTDDIIRQAMVEAGIK
jgi:hypothetical protein